MTILISLSFYGFKKWMSGILDNPIYFIFGIFTNISFYSCGNEKESRNLAKDIKKNSNKYCEDENGCKEIVEEEELNSKSVNIEMKAVEHISIKRFDEQEVYCDENVHEDIVIEDIESIETSMETQSIKVETNEQVDNSSTNDETVAFSHFQSNILYLLFFIGSISSISLDVWVQIFRKGWISLSSQYNLVIIIINFVLWADFQLEIRLKKSYTTGSNDGWLYEIMSYSNNSLLCFFLIPIFMIKKLYNTR